MITQENFKTNFSLIKTAFSIKFESNHAEESYLKLLFQVLKNSNLNDEDIAKNTTKLVCEYSKKKFNETFGFGGVPAPADFLEFFGREIKRELTPEDTAKIEVEKILYEARNYYSDWKPKNEVTKKVISCFNNGLSTIHYDLFDNWNDNKKNISFYKKDLIEKWLAFFNEKEAEPMAIDSNIKAALPNFKI